MDRCPREAFAIRPDYGINKAMSRLRSARPVFRPLQPDALDALALAYVARFATSQAKLARYLSRKLRERGWDGPGTAQEAVAAAVDRCVRLQFVNDREFARMRGDAFMRRGLGARQVKSRLAADGIDAGDAALVLANAASQRMGTALAFARRRRLGPFARVSAVGHDGDDLSADPKAYERAMGAFLRAGHDAGTARQILALAPDDTDGLAALEQLDAGDEGR
jgi:regulatory protein